MSKTAPAAKETPAVANLVDKRIDMWIGWDIVGGSPQGDPAQINNRPREDADTGLGLFTDAGYKRGIRDYILMAYPGVPGYDIHVRHKAILEDDLLQAQASLGITKDATSEENQGRVRQRMCEERYDVRAFGGVLAHSKKSNAGKITGPVQFTPFWSIDPLDPIEVKGTRVAVANKERSDSMDGFNQDLSVKYVVPYALFKGFGFVSPFWAKKCGFTWKDFDVLIEAMKGMHQIRHTSSSGMRTSRRIVAFIHDTHLGSAPAADLFDLVSVVRNDPDKPVRNFSDYTITVDHTKLPSGVTVKEF